MKPIKFKECNVLFAKNQKQYLPLPGYKRDGDDLGECLFCYQLTFIERIRVLLFGKLWLQILTFNNSLQPQRPSVSKPKID